MNIDGIQAQASRFGLVLRGAFQPADEDNVPCQFSGEPYAALLMFGQLGSSIWTSFSSSAEFADGKPDPLDRWSYRVGTALAEDLSGLALFPFEGPPWHPFGKWAQKAESIRPSPLGILLHPHYGLWHAYRFAIALPGTILLPSDQASDQASDLMQNLDIALSSRASSATGSDGDLAAGHACDQCASKPCLTACPVNAFADRSYDVAVCCDYLNSNPDAPCHTLGCRARGACPVGVEPGYVKEHNQFHMRHFLLSMNRSNQD